MTGEAFKAKVGFEAKINIVAKAKVGKFSTASRGAKVEVGKSSTANRGANSNIEGLDINNSAAGLIALIGLTILPNLVLPGRKIVVVAIRFSYFFISF